VAATDLLAGATLRCAVERRPAAAAEIDAAWRRLDAGAAGFYFGGDAGIAGLHPAAALLVVDPALVLRVHADGVEVEAGDAFGAALLERPVVARWRRDAARRAGAGAIASLRAFLALFEGGHGASADAILSGAFRFEAHRLAAHAGPPASDAVPLGVLFFAPVTWQRDAAGTWHRATLRFADAALQATATTFGAIEPRKAAPTPLAASVDPSDDFPPGRYARVVGRALAAMNDAGLVSLTLSQSFRRRLGARSPAEAFATLREVNPAPATFYLADGAGEIVFGASPDLQLRVAGGEVDAFPVCGTVARGHGPVGEAEALRSLFDEEVDAASLAICTDALRNDLAPLCVPGSLRLLARRRPMTLATVVHAVDHLRGRLRDDADAWDAIAATAAPVMVTGTPRAAALAVIAGHEASPRGWYGGLVVEVRGDGEARVGTMLRAAAVRDGVVEVRTGGDLVAGSDPAREELESRIKAVSLWRALGLAVDADLEASVAGGHAPPSSPEAALPAAVTLRADGDPFAAALAECLRGLGLALESEGSPVVFAGGDDAVARSLVDGRIGLVAIGDAAARVLRAHGHEVVAAVPQHGRLVQCRPVEGTPSASLRPFLAMRYATLVLGGDAAIGSLAGWSVWLRDAAGAPLVVACAAPRTVCFLIRPESLLSDRLALALLRDAIGYAAAGAASG